MIISASRRTDIPAFYSEWFINRLKQGYVMVLNPYNPNQISKINLSPDNVDCIVFWTKNPISMLDKLSVIQQMGYRYYFEFTITAYGSDIEKNLPEKQTIIDTFKRLSDTISPKCVDWRFDPIIINDEFSLEWNLQKFDEMCRQLGNYTERCIISFVDFYTHLGAKFKSIPKHEMIKTAKGISKIAKEYHLPLYTCSEGIDLSSFGIAHSSCIDQNKIEQIIGCPIKTKKHSAQRKFCRCVESVDIGIYNTCANGCIYCYATKNQKGIDKKQVLHNPNSPLLIGYPNGTEIITEHNLSSQKIHQISFFDN